MSSAPILHLFRLHASFGQPLPAEIAVRTSCIIKRLSLTFDSLRWRYLKKKQPHFLKLYLFLMAKDNVFLMTVLNYTTLAYVNALFTRGRALCEYFVMYVKK